MGWPWIADLKFANITDGVVVFSSPVREAPNRFFRVPVASASSLPKTTNPVDSRRPLAEAPGKIVDSFLF